MRYARRNLKWNGWGFVDRSFDLHGKEAALWAFLGEQFGVSALPATPSVAVEDVVLPASRLSDADIASLTALVGVEHVHTDHYERVYHAVGRSYRDLIRLRAGRIEHAPDAVVYPGSAEEIAALLAWASSVAVAVVPFGGGSSVVGGVEAQGGDGHRAVVTLDTTRLDRLLSVDRVSMTATAQAGIYGPDLERALGDQGLTVGHYPQSFEFSTLGGWIAARGSGQLCNRYGSSDRFTVSLRAATPVGELTTLDVPKAGAGPGLVPFVAGSEGILGVITEATVRVHAAPPVRDFAAVLFPTFAAATEAVRTMAQAGVQAAMVRVSDEDETFFFGQLSKMGKEAGLVDRLTARALAAKGIGPRPSAMLLCFEGDEALVTTARSQALAHAKAQGGLYVGRKPGKKWYAGRFNMPYLRDPILDQGLGLDTLETATTYQNLDAVYQAVRIALREAAGDDAIVLTHISHSYPMGASLYFTYVWLRDLDDPLGQWLRIKRAASDALTALGATISHHHGAGVDHAGWMKQEYGDVGLRLLAGAKSGVDPAGIMNPGKVLGPGL